MSDEAKPAMTADEWAAVLAFAKEQETDIASPGTLEGPLYTGDGHDVAARLLYGKPYGFSWADVDALDIALRDMEYASGEFSVTNEERAGDQRDQDKVRAIRGRIAGLLPPRTTNAGTPSGSG